MRILTCLLLLFLPGALLAHPLPNLRFDRVVEVKLDRTGVRVVYSLEINEWTMVLDGRGLITQADAAQTGTSRGFAKLYAERKAPLLADNFLAELGGQPLRFKVDKIDIEPERDHLRMRFQLSAAWPSPPIEPTPFRWEDLNFEDRIGEMTLFLKTSSDLVDLSDVVEPVDLRGKSPLDYKPGDEKRARRVSAIVTNQPDENPAPPAPAIARIDR